MRYLMRQKIFSLGEKFTIKNEAQEDVFQVQGKWISIGKKLTMRNMNEEVLFFIKQKVFAFAPTYFLFQGGPDGPQVAKVRKRLWSFLKARFDITLPDGSTMETEGNFIEHEYMIRRGTDAIATVSKKYLSLADTYTIDTIEGEDDAFIVALAVVIDMISHSNKN